MPSKMRGAGIFAQPVVCLGLSSLALLLLVIVLLSVPGPIKSLYWFQIPVINAGVTQQLRGGVNGWCWSQTANCTWGALSDNQYLASQFDVSLALTVETMVPLSCYWSIVVLLFWVLLTVTTPVGYSITGMEYISKHLYFNILETTVLCMQLFGCILSWMAYGFMAHAYSNIKDTNPGVKSGHSMETTAIAATVAMVTFAAGCYGLHLRIGASQTMWSEEARRCGAGSARPRGIEHRASTGMVGQFRASRSFDQDYEVGNAKRESSMYSVGQGIGGGHPIQIGLKDTSAPEMETMDEHDVHPVNQSMPRDPRA